MIKPEPVSNSKRTLLRKLNRKKYRQQEQLFLLEGARAVEQVLINESVAVEGLFFDEGQQYWTHPQWEKFLGNTDAYLLSDDVFAEVTDTDTPQGVLALCRMPEETAVEELISQPGIIVALDGIQDPGNLGTIIRTAAWFGVKGILSGRGTVDLFHPKVVRGTAGATGVIPHCNGKLKEILPRFEAAGWPVFLLDAGADSVALSEISSIDKAVIVIGNEAHGVDSELISGERRKVCISASQAHTGVESLNAAVATSIALYDLSAKLNSQT